MVDGGDPADGKAGLRVHASGIGAADQNERERAGFGPLEQQGFYDLADLAREAVGGIAGGPRAGGRGDDPDVEARRLRRAFDAVDAFAHDDLLSCSPGRGSGRADRVKGARMRNYRSDCLYID